MTDAERALDEALNSLVIIKKDDPEKRAIARLKIASDLAFHKYGKPLLLTYSGGKDSDTVLTLAKKSGIPYEVQTSHTTADAPETVYYIRKVFHDLELGGVKCYVNLPYSKGQRTSMWKLIPEKGYPPTRLTRYCCAVLKESHGKDRVITTGVRWAESRSRANRRGIFEKQVSNEEKAVKTTSDTDSLDDVFAPCKMAARYIVNPIVDWTEDDVWDYLHDQGVQANPLYCEGWKRVGCVGCPMAGGKMQAKEFQRWPKYRNMYIQAFQRMQERRIAKGKQPLLNGASGMDLFHWWIQDGVMPGQTKLWEDV